MQIKPISKNLLHGDVRHQSVREEGGIDDRVGFMVKPLVVPKRSGRSITDLNASDRTVGIKLIANNLPKVGRGGGGRFRKNGVIAIAKQPVLPRGRITRKKFVDKFEKKASILQLQVLQTKPPSNFTSANMLRGH